MFKNLSINALGFHAPLPEVLKLAKETGFQGVEIDIGEAANVIREKSVEYAVHLFSDADIQPGGWWLPIDYKADEAIYKSGLTRLPSLANIGKQIHCTRATTYILPYSDTRPFRENFRWHVERLRPIAEILNEHNCQLGLEFIGPKTTRLGHRYEFIYTIDGILELCDAIGTGNVGLLLDSWHWYTAHQSLKDLEKLAAKDVVYVHINDAPAGIPVDEQIDNIRCLPGETGVINLIGFLRTLKDIGYKGPVTPEPFSQKLRQMSMYEAAKTTVEALNRVWREAGLS